MKRTCKSCYWWEISEKRCLNAEERQCTNENKELYIPITEELYKMLLSIAHEYKSYLIKSGKYWSWMEE